MCSCGLFFTARSEGRKQGGKTVKEGGGREASVNIETEKKSKTYAARENGGEVCHRIVRSPLFHENMYMRRYNSSTNLLGASCIVLEGRQRECTGETGGESIVRCVSKSEAFPATAVETTSTEDQSTVPLNRPPTAAAEHASTQRKLPKRGGENSRKSHERTK